MANTDVTLTAELYADIKEPGDLNLNDKGTHIVYTLALSLCRASEHVVSSLWLADIASGTTRQLTRGDSHDHLPKFSPDGKSIAFLSDRSRAGEGDRIYLLPIDGIGGEALPLFEDPALEALQSSEQSETTKPRSEGKGVSSFLWSPDGSKIAFLSTDEDSPARKKQVEEEKDDVQVYGENVDYARLRIVDLSTKTCVTADTGDVHVNMYDWSPDGQRICWAETTSPDINSVFRGNGWLSIIQLGQDLKLEYTNRVKYLDPNSSSLCWCDDGFRWIGGVDKGFMVTSKTIYGISSANIDNGSFESERLGFGDTNDSIGLRKCQNKAVAWVHNGMWDDIWPVGANAAVFSEKKAIGPWDMKVVDGVNIIALTIGAVTSPWEVWICTSVPSATLASQNLRQLSHHSKSISDLRLGSVQWLSYKTEDGVPIDGYYCIPKNKKAAFDNKEPLPTVVYAHGGPYWRTSEGFDEHIPWFVAQGYLVLMTNYRGGSGYGNEYAKTVRHHAGASYQDVVWLVKKCVEEGHVDKDKVCMYGWSQGGYLAYMAVTHDEDFHFAGSIAGAGVTDWTTMAMTSDIPTIEAELAGPGPWNSEPENIVDRKSSPIYYMQNINTPLLILHGELDARVPQTQALGFHFGMLSKGKECEMAIYPREGHGYPIPFERAHFLDLVKRIQRFLSKHIG